jgi:hypothetical protein
VRCDDRTATWQIWVPAAELTLLTHYSASSLPSRILAVLEMILQQLRGRTSRQALDGFGLPATKNQVKPSLQLAASLDRSVRFHPTKAGGSVSHFCTNP